MLILNKFIEKIKNLDSKIKKILHIGFVFSFSLCIFSVVLLLIYQTIYTSPDLYYTGLSLFKSSLMFGCSFVMCAIGFDTIKNEIA